MFREILLSLLSLMVSVISPGEVAEVIEARFNQIDSVEAFFEIELERPASYLQLMAKRVAAARTMSTIAGIDPPSVSDQEIKPGVVARSTVKFIFSRENGVYIEERGDVGQQTVVKVYDSGGWKSLRGKNGIIHSSPLRYSEWTYLAFGLDTDWIELGPQGSKLHDVLRSAESTGNLALADRSMTIFQPSGMKTVDSEGGRMHHELSFDESKQLALISLRSEVFFGEVQVRQPLQPRRWSEVEWEYGLAKDGVLLPTRMVERQYEGVMVPTKEFSAESLRPNQLIPGGQFEFESYLALIRRIEIVSVDVNGALSLDPAEFEFPDGSLITDEIEMTAFQVGDANPEIQAAIAAQFGTTATEKTKDGSGQLWFLVFNGLLFVVIIVFCVFRYLRSSAHAY